MIGLSAMLAAINPDARLDVEIVDDAVECVVMHGGTTSLHASARLRIYDNAADNYILEFIAEGEGRSISVGTHKIRVDASAISAPVDAHLATPSAGTYDLYVTLYCGKTSREISKKWLKRLKSE